VLNKRIEVLLKKIEMLKHDSSEETKTYSADSYERRSLQNAQKNKGLKKDIIDIQDYLRITRKQACIHLRS
jgi:hypothetical protein